MDLVLPAVLTGRTPDAFVRRSIVERLPDILLSARSSDDATESETDAKISALAAALRSGSYEIEAIDASDGGPDWTQLCAGRVGKNALDVEWLFLELYVYRLLLSSAFLDFFARPGSVPDPFAQHKAEALASALKGLTPHAALGRQALGRDAAGFRHSVMGCLWGNQTDLSFSSGQFSTEAMDQNLLIDDSQRCWAALFAGLGPAEPEGAVVLVLDNCGAELLNDLLLADFLLRHFPRLKVALHAKTHPIFVSDAVEADVWHHIDCLCRQPGFEPVGERLRAAATGASAATGSAAGAGALSVTSHDFYCSPEPFWNAPPQLRDVFASALLTVTKGDANYRRLLDDRLWPCRIKFESILGRYWPASSSLLAIRTCKSPVTVGVPEAVLARPPLSPDWQVDGKTGLVSFLPTGKPSDP